MEITIEEKKIEMVEEYAELLIKLMANEIGTYQSPLVRSMARRCSIVAVDLIIKSDTQSYYGDFYKNVRSRLITTN